MNRIVLTAVSLIIATTVGLPSVALAEAPATTPMVIVNEGFEGPAVYAQIPRADAPYSGVAYGQWFPVTWPAHGEGKSLWCEGTNPTAVSTHLYNVFGGGTAVFDLSATAQFYSSDLTFYYKLPSRGAQDVNSFNVATQWSDVDFGSDSNDVWPITSAWTKKSIDLSNAPVRPLSRHGGLLRFSWLPDAYTGSNGEGPSIDDVSVTGWRYGPVRNLLATPSSGGATLSWARPWASTAATGTEDRTIAYRVYRAPAGTSTWTELTDARLSDSALGFVDTTAPPSTAYDYAVQAWEPSTGTGYGMLAQASMTTRAIPTVGITAPANGALVTSTAATTNMGGTVTPPSGTTIVSVRLTITRDGTDYWNGSAWQSTVTSVSAGLGAGTWNYSWTLPANENQAHLYSVTALARDAMGSSASATSSFRVNTTTQPSVSISMPLDGALITSTAVDTPLNGTVAAVPGTTISWVHVIITRDGSEYWNGSSWQSAPTSVTAGLGSGTWNYSWPLPAGENQTHGYTVTAFAQDALGMVGSSAPAAFRVDTRVPPVVDPPVVVPPAPVKNAVSISRAPSKASATYKRKKGVAKYTLSARVVDANGVVVAGQRLYLQSSTNKKKWKTAGTYTTSAGGTAAKAFRSKSRSTVYYRWYSPETTLHFKAYTGTQKVIVK